jgi:ElaB/YqjD/DUF883 family membrane-anchored ribosome-binding protein
LFVEKKQARTVFHVRRTGDTLALNFRKELKIMEARTRDINVGDVRETAENIAGRAREMGNAAVEKAQALYETASNKAIAGAKATDRAIRENPYQALGIAFGVGLLIGFLTRRK